MLEPTDALGNRAADTQPQLQQDVFKELINKLAWALGSTYRAPYANTRSQARGYAVLMAKAILRDHGYPKQIAK